jgi:hypothetical protein
VHRTSDIHADDFGHCCEPILDGLRVAQAQGRRGGRLASVDDVLAIARTRRARGELRPAVSSHLLA